MTTILALDMAGTPRAWINCDEAISYHAKDLVAWSLGETVAEYHGGFNRLTGKQSKLETSSIIAIKGSDFHKHTRVVLTNPTLFARDRHVCAYCGFTHVNHRFFSRDHIVPRSRGGVDEWTNVVTACIPCNQEKGAKTLKESGMSLLYVPYAPNHYENMILKNKRILADQMEYLLAGVPKHSRVWWPTV
jgi:5-methylcytosine-specific restriction endonuclease McrA